MTCEQCQDQLSDLLEGELAPAAEREVRSHLATCPECARRLSELQTLVSALRGLPEIEPPAELRERLREIATRPSSGFFIWSRTRYVVVTVAAAAAALLLIYTGVTHYGSDATAPALAPSVGGARTALEAAVPPAEAVAEEGIPAGGVRVAEAEKETVDTAAEAEEEPAREAAIERHELGPRRPAEGPARRERAPSAPPPPPRAVGTDRDEGAIEEAPAPAADRAPAGGGPEGWWAAEPDAVPTEPARGGVGASSPDLRSGTVVAASARPERRGAAGPAGPAPPEGATGFARSEAAMGGAGGTLTVPAPVYLAADGSPVATGEGSPFEVAVTPPQEKITDAIVPAAIAIETEQDVARARVTVSASEGLELVDLGPEGLLFDGPLAAGRQTVLSVRLLARQPGEQAMTMRLRSTDPVVDTCLAVSLGEFRAPVPPRERPVRFEFIGTPIRDAVAEIVRQSGMRVEVDERVRDATVTLRSEDHVPAEAALRMVADQAGFTVGEGDGKLTVEVREEGGN